jgi:Rox3 mediator complex subunit
MYNLTALAAEVARDKPNGEKNPLRKTYKGHIKRLGISGHFDAVKHYEDEKDREDARKKETEFLSILARPQEDWYNTKVKGLDVSNGLSDLSTAALGKAMTMSRGRILLPTSKWNGTVLGEQGTSSEPSKQTSSAKPTAPSTPSASTPTATGKPKPQQASQGQDPARPKRNVKKRSYGDSSFEGYGEGYPDDDGGMDTGYSSGGGDDRAGVKRRKKVGIGSPYWADESNQPQNPGNTQAQFPGVMRQQSYGPGMVGV